MTHSEIDRRYHDLPIDLSDEAIVAHLVRVAWHVLPLLDPLLSEPTTSDLFAAHSALKDALKALVPERPGDTIGADAMRRALTSAVSRMT